MNQALKVTLLMLLALGVLVASCSAPETVEIPRVVAVPQADEVPQVGKPAPDFQIINSNGQAGSLSDFHGKPVLINFWTTWCYSCRYEMPYIQEVYDEWSGQGLVVLAVDIGESPSQVEKFIQAYNLSFPVLLDMAGKVAEQYNIRYIPTTYFIDGSGITRDIKIGAFNSPAEIEGKLGGIFP